MLLDGCRGVGMVLVLKIPAHAYVYVQTKTCVQCTGEVRVQAEGDRMQHALWTVI